MLALAPFSLLALASSAAATITVRNPGPGQYWRKNSTNAVQWETSGTDNPALFSVYLQNYDATLPPNGLSIANNIPTEDGSTVIPSLPDYLPLIGNWFLRFVHVSNVTDVYAESGLFELVDDSTSAATTVAVQPIDPSGINTTLPAEVSTTATTSSGRNIPGVSTPTRNSGAGAVETSSTTPGNGALVAGASWVGLGAAAALAALAL